MTTGPIDQGATAPTGEPRRVEMLLPPPMKGSGGHRTAVAGCEALAAVGHEVHIHFRPQGPSATTQSVTSQAMEWHGATLSTVHLGWPESFSAADAVIATTWQSAAYLVSVPCQGTRMHFVQDYEAMFHPMGDEYVAAAGVHDLGLSSLVIGNWLKMELMTQHALPAFSVPFTADKDVYRPRNPGGADRLTVVAMYQPDKSRRCHELMRASLSEVLRLHPEVEVVTVGSPASPELGPRHRHLGLVSKEDLAAIYSAATVGFSISSSNPSRVPFEMMAVGLPVVEFGARNTVYDLPDTSCVLAHPDPDSMSTAILDILGDRGRQDGMSRAGQRFMSDRPSSLEAAAFVRGVEQIIKGVAPSESMPRPLYSAPVTTAPRIRPWIATADQEQVERSAGASSGEEDQLLVNEALNVVNEELNKANLELNSINHELNDVNTELHARNRDMELRCDDLEARLRAAERAYSRTLEGRIAARRRRGVEQE